MWYSFMYVCFKMVSHYLLNINTFSSAASDIFHNREALWRSFSSSGIKVNKLLNCILWVLSPYGFLYFARSCWRLWIWFWAMCTCGPDQNCRTRTQRSFLHFRKQIIGVTRREKESDFWHLELQFERSLSSLRQHLIRKQQNHWNIYEVRWARTHRQIITSTTSLQHFIWAFNVLCIEHIDSSTHNHFIILMLSAQNNKQAAFMYLCLDAETHYQIRYIMYCIVWSMRADKRRVDFICIKLNAALILCNNMNSVNSLVPSELLTKALVHLWEL